MLKILERLLGIPGGSGAAAYEDARAIRVYLRCAQCGEAIALRLRKSDEVQRNYDDGACAFYVQKTVIGNRCFNRIPIRLEMDPSYKLISQEISGGQYLTREEFDLLAAGHGDSNAPD